MSIQHILSQFLMFGPLIALIGLALFMMAASAREAQLAALFTWLENEGKERTDHDYARDCYARAKLCRNATIGFAVGAVFTALSLVSAVLINQSGLYDQRITLFIFVLGAGFAAFGLVMMVLDAKVEQRIFRARYEHLTGRDASMDSMWGGV